MKAGFSPLGSGRDTNQAKPLTWNAEAGTKRISDSRLVTRFKRFQGYIYLRSAPTVKDKAQCIVIRIYLGFIQSLKA